MTGRARWYTGVGALVVGLAPLLTQLVVPSLDLRPWIALMVGFAAALVVLLVGLVRSQLDARAADRELETRLDAALACWPPRPAGRLLPHDVGAHPSGATPPYVAREDLDVALDAALVPGDAIVVLCGPARAGKSRSAFQALRRHRDAPKLLMPEDDRGLATLLAGAEAVDDLVEGPLVLWLDELERFLPGLDLDVVDRLAEAGRPLRIVATVDEAALGALLAEESRDPCRHRARRLLARARAIHVPAPAQPLPGGLDGRLGDGWNPTPRVPVATLSHPWRPTVAMGALAALLLALVVGGGLYVRMYDWTAAPDLARQVAEMQDDADDCEDLSSSPARATELSERDVLVVIVRRERCLASDEVRLFHEDERSGDLESALTLRPPADDPPRRFACVSVRRDDPCTLTVEGGARVVVGTFSHPHSRQALPVAVQSTAKVPLLASLAPRPPAAERGLDHEAQRMNRRGVTLRFSRAAGDGCDPLAYCVTSHGAQTWAAFSSDDETPAVLVAGLLAAGSVDAPSSVVARAWRIVLDERQAPVARQRCFIFRDGIRQRLVVSVPSAARAHAALGAAWERARTASGADVVC